jgi:hypothetical protein
LNSVEFRNSRAGESEGRVNVKSTLARAAARRFDDESPEMACSGNEHSSKIKQQDRTYIDIEVDNGRGESKLKLNVCNDGSLEVHQRLIRQWKVGKQLVVVDPDLHNICKVLLYKGWNFESRNIPSSMKYGLFSPAPAT